MSDFNDPHVLAVHNAVQQARALTQKTHRKHVVRDDYGKLFITPLYLEGYEGERHDPGYTGLGVLVRESLA